MLPRNETAGLKRALGYSPRVADVNKHSLSPPKTICAGEEPHPTRDELVCIEHNRSKRVNLEKQFPILQCECHAYRINGSG